MLYIVSTPIGNLEDITLRALRILKEVDIIACEDTRQTRKLLTKYEIPSKSLIPYHDKNERSKSKHLLNLLLAGKSIALVSDSGTPLLSDPGYHIINLCIDNNIPIIPIPGPSALLAALTVSGASLTNFQFLGFFPKKQKSKTETLEKIKKAPVSVLYESPHRIQKTLKLLSETIPDKKIVICRELTKKHEEIIRGTIAEVYNNLKERTLKGEIVLIIH